jgi:heme/copper-type cytochrome/quinol oxidase subunit 1
VRRAVPWLVALLGAALVVAGVVVFAAANRGLVDFGWTAYAPLEQTQQAYQRAITFTDSATVLWTGQHLLGAGLLVLGLLVLIGVCCWLLGRRAGRREALRT